MQSTATTTNWIRRLTAIAAAMALYWSPTTLAGEPDGCEPGWAEGLFPINPLDIGLNGEVLAMTEFDTGDGPQLIVGGAFTRPANGDEQLLRLAKWTGEGWGSIGRIEGYNSPLLTRINTMAVYDDGSGPKLYIGGRFQGIDGEEIANIACWDGTTWSSLGEGLSFDGLSKEVRAMAVYRTMDGEEVLVVGGDFNSAGGMPSTNHIAIWTGTSWRSLGDIFTTGDLNGPVYALDVQETDGEQVLYAGGSFFVYAAGISNNIARWNGFFWSGFGEGVGEWPESTVHAVEVIDHGAGPIVYAGGDFENSVGSPTSGIRAWDGVSWEDPGGGVGGVTPHVFTLETLMIGDEPCLLVGGSFDSASAMEAQGLALWSGTDWSLLPSDVEFGPSAVFRTSYMPAEKTIADLVVGGQFSSPDLRSSAVALWRDGVWDKAPNIGLNAPVTHFVPGLISTEMRVFGSFTNAGVDVAAQGAAIWVGGVWEVSDVAGVETGPDFAPPYADLPLPIIEYDDENGPSLFSVRNIGTPVTRQEVVKWNGEAWDSFGISAGPHPSPALASITDIAAIETGPARGLYVAGTSLDIADLPGLWDLARWDGETWTPIPIESNSGFSPRIQSLASIQQGKSELLYIAGGVGSVWQWDGITATESVVLLEGERFPRDVRQVLGFQGKVTVLRNDPSSGKIIVLEGDDWVPLPPAPGGTDSDLIYSTFRELHVIHGPLGEYLYTTPSYFSSAFRADLLRFDGTNWSVVASEVNGPIYTVAAHDDGTGPALYIGGDFSEVDGVPSGYMAKRPFCDDQPCPADVTGDGLIDLADLNTVLAAFGQQTDIGDTNGDGVVDLADLNTVLGAFGAVCK